MDEYLHSRHKEAFLKLLADPTDTGAEYLVNLHELVKAYPQSGLFRAMYGRALNEATPTVAGGYFDNRALHKLLYHPDSLLPVGAGQIITEHNQKSFTGSTGIKEEVAEPETFAIADSDITAPIALPESFPDTQEAERSVNYVKETKLPEEPEYPLNQTTDVTEPIAEKPEITVDEEPLGRAPWDMDDEEEEPAPAIMSAETPHTDTFPVAELKEDQVALQPAAEEVQDQVTPPVPVAEERTPWDLIAEEYAAQAARNGQAPLDEAGVNFIDDEIYEEIIGIENITITRPPYEIEAAPVAAAAADIPDGNIDNTNYFSFDPSFGQDEQEAQAAPEPAAQEVLQLNKSNPDENTSHQNEVSRYHDEKMPYTFMWWLDKTRKEHDATYQPYVKAPGNEHYNKPAKKGKPDELQQQYIENIFHLSPPDNVNNTDEPATVEFDMQVKEDRIIKRFITEEPHIHPPVGEKLDTENKAKKSSEDDYEVVTETLARIYTDQMLYPKAIATYKKLMLKFPEKSRYFASRIDALEKRTN